MILMEQICQNVSAGKEIYAIPAFGPREQITQLQEFAYTKLNTLPNGMTEEMTRLSDASGCSCVNGNCLSSCTCWENKGVECGAACSCSQECENRGTQNGLQYRMYLQFNEKGWSAFAAEPISRGNFVCQYAGELMNNDQSQKRLRIYDGTQNSAGHALLIVREILPSNQCTLRVNIDATKCGNVARFFNHSCDGGNLNLNIIRVCGKILPHVAMIARKDIKLNEELTFAYGRPNAGSKIDQREPSKFSQCPFARPCFCGSKACLGYLPAEF